MTDFTLVSTPITTPPRRVIDSTIERGLRRRDTPPPGGAAAAAAEEPLSPGLRALHARSSMSGEKKKAAPVPVSPAGGADAHLADGLSLRAAGRWLSSVGRTSDAAWLEAEHGATCKALRRAIAQPVDVFAEPLSHI